MADSVFQIALDPILREALEVADHASCVINARGDMVYCNAAFCDLTGFSAADLASGGYALLRSPEAPPQVYREMWHTVRTGRVWRGRLPYRHKDGSTRPSSAVVTPFGAEPGATPAFFYVTQLDISDQIAREEERRRVRERLEREIQLRSEELGKLYNISAALHTSLDLEETLRMVLVAVTAGEGYRFNRAFLFLREHGDPDQLVGRLAMGPFDSEEAAHIWRALSEARDQDEPLADVVRRYCAQAEEAKNGLTRLVQSIRIPLDEPLGPLAAAVREQRSYRVGPEAPRQGWSCQAIEALRSPAFAVVPLIYRDEAEGCILVDNAITGETITPEEVRILELFADHASHAIANAMLYERAQDLLDERNQALDQLRANQQRLVEVEKMAALGRMAAIVVHELRTPLAVIGGYARHILKHADEDIPFRHDLLIVRDEVTRLEDVVERLLYYARPKEPLLKPGSLNACLARLLDYLSAEFDRHRLQVDRRLDPALPECWFDERQIRQVALNLLTNAVQATPDGGTVTVTTAREDNAARLEVTDSGGGLSPDILPHLFEPFQTTKPKGTGLGLHVALRIVEGHRGRIHAETLPEGGARFIVRLPLVPGDRIAES